jgi:hypothetical protein
MATSTPWGTSQLADKVCRGIIFYSTAGHGGYHVSKTLNQKIHESLRLRDGWYEEDCDWAIVVFSFPHLFKPQTVEQAIRILKSYYPDEYEAITEQKIAPGESRTRDEKTFYENHQNDFIVTAAWGHWHDSVPANFVATAAVRGLDKSCGETKYFLVPKDEYQAKRDFAFVIDPGRHREIEPIR